ncbi:MAG: hypothetical protein H7X76_02970 [Prolixibacteraceae bacterium]|nr:hypothetical protein [Burkholderiales bacterium]
MLATACLGLLCAFAQAALAHRYDVTVDQSLERISVRACFNGKAPEALVAESDGARFYLESMRLGDRALEPVEDKVILGATQENTCVDYQVNLQPAQSRAQTGGPETRRVGRDMLTSIGDWLWRPPESETYIELRFHLPPGMEVSAPWPRRTLSDGQPVFLIGATPYNWSGVVAIGHFAQRVVQVPGAVLHLALLDTQSPAHVVQLEQWIETTARNVTLLYGRFPVASLQVVVAPTPSGRGPVPWAYVSRGGGPAVHLFINPARPAEEFARDWSLTHEMSHLFLPYVIARDAWLFEGLPTYLQNVLMARGEAVSVEEAWRRMQAGFRRGARTAPDLSLTRATERMGRNGIYQRVYWAGAAMLLGADLQLRKQTGGRHSLGTALEQLSRCCASEQRRWSAQEIIVRLDDLTGTTVFSELVRTQFEGDNYPDYEAVMARAGVKFEGGRVEFDASAPWAAERDALMLPSAIAPR